MNYNKNFIIEKSNVLNFHIQSFNELQKKDKNQNLKFPEFKFSGDAEEDKNLLNKIHAMFESWAGTPSTSFPGRNRVPEAETHLARINMNVHLVEQRLLYYYSKEENPVVYSRVSFCSFNTPIKMSSQWYSEFSMQTAFGDLRMNYATRGKALHHLFHDNDLIHMQAGGKPAPQEVFNEGIHAYFSGHLYNKLSDNNVLSSHEDRLNQLKNWHQEEKLEEKYGIKNEPHQCLGYIILGKFLPTGELNCDSTVKDVIDYYSDCTEVVSYKILDLI